jgi:hypothetical protein
MFAFTAATTAQTPAAIDYRFDKVTRKVTLVSSSKELRVEAGQRAQGGDRVQTGWLSYALIASEHYRAKFEVFGSTDVTLASGEPGVILSLERGKLRAMFDKITGNEPRIVKTPGALLAVRGTAYNIEVDDAGKTTLRVFEGIVEVRSEFRKEPMFVPAGQTTNFGRREPPSAPRQMPDRAPNGTGPDGRDGHGAPGDPRGGVQPPPSNHGAPPPGGNPPPPPPPGGHH